MFTLLFLRLSFLLFPCVSVFGKTVEHEFHISYNHLDWNLISSLTLDYLRCCHEVLLNYTRLWAMGVAFTAVCLITSDGAKYEISGITHHLVTWSLGVSGIIHHLVTRDQWDHPSLGN